MYFISLQSGTCTSSQGWSGRSNPGLLIHRVPQGLHLQEYYKYKASLPVFADPFLCSPAVDLLVFLFSLKYMKTITIMKTPTIPTMIMIQCFIAKPPLPFVASVIVVIVVVVVDVVDVVVAVPASWPAHVLSSLGLHSLFFMPWLTHSLIFSSLPSEQQAEHSWQLWRVSLMKYPFSHFPLHTVSLLLVHSAFFISCSAHWWHALHGEESYALENVPVLQAWHAVVGGSCRALPHFGCNPNPLWHVSQDRHLWTVPVEFIIAYWFSPQIIPLLLGCITFKENK